jgi:RNA-directed DNA polymerase
MPRRQVQRRGIKPFLEELRSALKAITLRPLPVRQAAIPKRGGKLRYLGIPTLRD